MSRSNNAREYVAILTVDSSIDKAELRERLTEELEGTTITVEEIANSPPAEGEEGATLPTFTYRDKCKDHPTMDIPCPLH